jgi:F-box-like
MFKSDESLSIMVTFDREAVLPLVLHNRPSPLVLRRSGSSFKPSSVNLPLWAMARRSNVSIDIEAASVKAQLELLERREEEFEKLLHDMQRLKESLSAEKKTLIAKALALEAERHPIHWLPPELLAQIFLVFVDLIKSDDEGFQDDATAFHHPSVTISHVCQRWRNIALSIPSLWSCLAYHGAQWQEDMRPTFINRSGNTPLYIIYRARPETPILSEKRKVSLLFDDLNAHLERLQSIVLQCGNERSIEGVVRILNRPSYRFPHLRSLQLSIISPVVSFTSARSLLENNHPDTEPQASSTSDIPRWSNLTHLKLHEVPLFNLPTHFLANLSTLVLSFRPIKNGSRAIVNRYRLRMSSLCSFLEFAPNLEDLTLANTVPYFDTVLQGDGISNVSSVMKTRSRVLLCQLKRFDWTYPYAPDVQQILPFFDTPALEKIDLWVEVDRGDYIPRRPAALSTSPEFPIPGGQDFPLLRDLTLQCASEETTSTVLRKFTFPVLEKFELINTDMGARTGDQKLPPVPRLESIFRDPRLPHLTHLTLSHFDIPQELCRAEAMLGYMPALTSLSLDTCSGVSKLVLGLTAKVVGTLVHTPEGTKIRRNVKFCPRFEALSLWSCEDVEIDDLCALVIARNRQTDEEVDLDASDMPPNASIVNQSRNVVEKSPTAVVGRAIKPLRKSRLQRQNAGSGFDCSIATVTPSSSTSILSTIVAMVEASRPAIVAFIRIENCPSITQEEALRLKGFGVVDVVCNSELGE